MHAPTGLITKDDLISLQLPATIDEVIAQLEKIIIYCQTNNNCAGYFAVLYHKVTCKVRECININDFEDGLRMERLDVTFANRYLIAFYDWIAGKPTTNSWKIAFNAIAPDKSLVLQHLLLGMNAHINLDLGIATTSVMEGSVLEDIHKDFDIINSILSSMIDNIEDCLTKINPLMRLLNLHIYKYDEMLVQFSIKTARDGAWVFAQQLNGKKGNDYNGCVNTRDVSIQQIGNSIANPRGFLLRLIVGLIRLFEKKSVSAVMNFLGA